MSLQQILSAVTGHTRPANDHGAFGSAAQTDYDKSSAEHRWDDEGGCNNEPTRFMRWHESVEVRIKTETELAKQVAAMSDRLTADFVNAQFGTSLKTMAHRSRVLRQLKARLKGERAAAQAVIDT